MLCGGDSMLDLERLRADAAGGRAARGRRSRRRRRRVSSRAASGVRICVAPSSAFAAARTPRRPAGRRRWSRDAGLRLAQVEVYGRSKPGAGSTTRASWRISRCCARGRSAAGCWRPSCSRAATPPAARSPGAVRRALQYLPDGHGHVCARFDSGFYRVDLLATAARWGCASRSRCRARRRCGRRCSASTRTRGSPPTGSPTPRSPTRPTRRRLGA